MHNQYKGVDTSNIRALLQRLLIQALSSAPKTQSWDESWTHMTKVLQTLEIVAKVEHELERPPVARGPLPPPDPSGCVISPTPDWLKDIIAQYSVDPHAPPHPEMS